MSDTQIKIPADSPLDKAGSQWLKAAAEYWKEFQKISGGKAVVWLEGDGGQLVMFTRGEYKRSILNACENFNDHNPLPEYFFEDRK
jgi:hypothetical protein